MGVRLKKQKDQEQIQKTVEPGTFQTLQTLLVALPLLILNHLHVERKGEGDFWLDVALPLAFNCSDPES